MEGVVRPWVRTPIVFAKQERGDVPAVSRYAFASERGVSVAMIQLHLKMLVEGKE